MLMLHQEVKNKNPTERKYLTKHHDLEYTQISIT